MIVGRLDDGNVEDGLTVDVDIELRYNVGEDEDNNVGTADGINELNKDGLVVGKDVDASLVSTVGDTLGTKDEMIYDGMQEGTVVVASLGLKEGKTVDAEVGFTLGTEVGMDDGMQDGTAVGASLG